MTPSKILRTDDHNRSYTHFRYVYPVVSRRAQGVSIGVNLNINNACNWRCIYCQVPELIRGAPPLTDLALLETELRTMLHDILNGDFMEQHVPASMRNLHDIAFSGNGEPTTSPNFLEAVSLVANIAAELPLKIVLITNGSMMAQPHVQQALHILNTHRGEVWFKIDRATPEGIAHVNGHRHSPESHLSRLHTAATLCNTWIQTCVFAYDGLPPSSAETSAYLDMLRQITSPILGVLLYNIARPSHREEAEKLSPVSATWIEDFATQIRALGLTVQVSA